MRYEEFREKVHKLPFFRANILEQLQEKPEALKVQLSHWVKKGLVIKLRQGIYTLNDSQRSCKFTNYFLANNLYSPSYISLEYALQFYGFIPEGVFVVTSISTKKTENFDNQFGRFQYRTVKLNVYRHFIEHKDIYGNRFYIASPEKALLDFLYFATAHIKKIKSDIFEESFRLQNLENVDCNKLIKYAEAYEQKKIISTAKMLVDYITEEWQS